jgi:two-component system sensor histidine kinase KdpD
LKRQWVPLEEMIGSALTRLERFLGERPVNVDLPDGLPLLSVDPVLFEQVFVNLFENASRYTPAGSPIDIAARLDGGKKIVIEVSDAGGGFAPGTEERIFEKFFRGEHAGQSGAGLGLPICKAIVEAHGGVISAENRRGGGALIRIALPVAPQIPSVQPLPSNIEQVPR